MDLGLKGKTVLLTGASRGLGFATAKALIQEGARIAINSRDEQKLADAKAELTQVGGDVVILPGDVSDPATPEKLVHQAASALGGIDMIFTNSGGPPPMTFEDISDELWLETVNLAFMSHVRLIRAALPYLRKSTVPAVLTVTSISVKQPIPTLILSNAIRAATVGLTKTLALELGPENIRFNSILPSYTHTERVERLLADTAKRKGTSLEEEIEAQNQRSPLGRMGTPEEFANAAVFLLSPAASYITGLMLNIDGGTYKGLF